MKGNNKKTVPNLPNTMKTGPEKVEKRSCSQYYRVESDKRVNS